MFKGLDYELLDIGEGRKLERFGDVIVDRPSPQSLHKKSLETFHWGRSDAFYDKDKGWVFKNPEIKNEWFINLFEFNIKLKFSSSGQVGIFPEQFYNWIFFREKLSNLRGDLKVLNGFAFTGVSDIVLSEYVDEIVHVDGASSAIRWAKENVALNSIDKKIRFIEEDMLTFMRREIKRGNRYNAFIFDPPEFGRGRGREWSLKKDLPELIKMINLLVDIPKFVIFTTHAKWMSKKLLIELIKGLKFIDYGKLELFDLKIQSNSGKFLDLGICARWMEYR